jgi:von Willebrand factor type A domain-containing protein
MCQTSTGAADPSCTDLNNAKAGIRTFLSYFDPKQAHIGLAVLPPATSLSAKCTTPQSTNYNSASAAYLLVPLSSDFRNTNGTLNTSSNLVSTLACVQGNGTTSYANAIDAAQAQLVANGRSNVPHVIVFFSDGAANTGPSYYSSTSPYRAQPCHQGVNSAGSAKAAGTTVYSIGYALDDDTGGCKNANGTVENPAITVYQALGGMASSSDKFLVKPNPGELQTIYTTIAEDISAGSSSLIG